MGVLEAWGRGPARSRRAGARHLGGLRPRRIDAIRATVDGDVEWVPLSEGRPVSQDEFWGEWGQRRREQISATVHGYERHGPCVLAKGSLRTLRDGGFVDVQPSWVYYFREGRLVRAVGYSTREAALSAISAYRAAA